MMRALLKRCKVRSLNAQCKTALRGTKLHCSTSSTEPKHDRTAYWVQYGILLHRELWTSVDNKQFIVKNWAFEHRRAAGSRIAHVATLPYSARCTVLPSRAQCRYAVLLYFLIRFSGWPSRSAEKKKSKCASREPINIVLIAKNRIVMYSSKMKYSCIWLKRELQSIRLNNEQGVNARNLDKHAHGRCVDSEDTGNVKRVYTIDSILADSPD